MARTTAGLLAGAAVALLAFTAAEAQTARKSDTEREQTRQLNQEQLRMIQGRASGGMDSG
ncbi:MAG: hypothetical protein IRZ04_21070, partial [Rhodospirillales bacterium]|nr:hypothetical protein [Rhodospirillales bacterium]